jgi:hypothetical protein
MSAPTAAEAPSFGPKLQAKLKGRVAGEPVSCVPMTTRSRTSIVDTSALVFSRGSKTLFVNFPACPFLREDRAVVLDGDKRRICEGDEVMVVHLESDIIYGACRMGPFIPYSRAKS